MPAIRNWAEVSAMLRELRVSNMAVIVDARLDVGSGFTALTGETGSGKSVCVGALRAALGGRIDSDVLRPAAATGRATAVFDGVTPALRARIAGLGIPDDELLTVSREIVRGGRGSCRINGALVSLSVLREVGDAVAEVTSQGASQRLLRRPWQRDLLDAAGGEAGLNARRDAADAIRMWRDATAALDGARRAARSGAAEVERARELIADIAPLKLRAGEADELSAERARLRSASRLVSAAEAIAGAVSDDDAGAADSIATAVAPAADLTGIDPGLGALVDEANLLVDRLRDLGLDARRYAESIALDEGRLAEVEERLDVIARVTRRHGSINDALAEVERAQQLIAATDGGEELIGRHQATVDVAHVGAGKAAAALSRARAAGARRLERTVTEQLRELELPDARFRIVLSRVPDADGLDTGDGYPVRCGVDGVDDVEFRLVTNRDMVPAPLDQGPSGGELSRLALALSAVVSEAGAPILVLDEVDTGIGGETAARVGDVLSAIGDSRQVLAVTHRPEIAARASTHLLVTKKDAPGLPAAHVDRVEGRERTAEIARLMSGRATHAALRRAEELLHEGALGTAVQPARRSATRTM
jgi:DNA repair protein RecN (Recombination protein N)